MPSPWGQLNQEAPKTESANLFIRTPGWGPGRAASQSPSPRALLTNDPAERCLRTTPAVATRGGRHVGWGPALEKDQGPSARFVDQTYTAGRVPEAPGLERAAGAPGGHCLWRDFPQVSLTLAEPRAGFQARLHIPHAILLNYGHTSAEHLSLPPRKEKKPLELCSAYLGRAEAAPAAGRMWRQ